MDEALGRTDRPQVLLCDIDGVVRKWRPDVAPRLERELGIDADSISKVAFARPLLRRLQTGQVTDTQWRSVIAGRLAELAGVPESRARSVLDDWSAAEYVDPEVLDLVRAARRHIRVFLATNGSDATRDQMVRLGVLHEFDGLINSAEHGTAKPSTGFYETATTLAGCEARRCLFVDDLMVNVQGAQAAGIDSHHYTSTSVFRNWLEGRVGVPLGSESKGES